MADITLNLFTIPVYFLDGETAEARAEGNNAAWHCQCDTDLPLVGRCYFQFGHDCHTTCPSCEKTFRVLGDENKRANRVNEI